MTETHAEWNIPGTLSPEKLDQDIPYVNITEVMEIDSALPAGEKRAPLTPRSSVVIYDRALRRDSKDMLPVVVGLPHAGELIPEDLWKQVKVPGIFGHYGGLDVVTIDIFAPRGGEYASARARVSRVVVDPNRGPEQLTVPPPTPDKPAIGGVSWDTDLENNLIYDRVLTDDEKRELVKMFYGPYYQVLNAMVGTLFDRGNKNVLFVDGHSYRSDLAVASYGMDGKTPMPLFVIGTRDNSTAAEELVTIFAEELQTNTPGEFAKNPMTSELVALNAPFKGVRNVQYWGRPTGLERPEDIELPVGFLPQTCHSIQLEVDSYGLMDKQGRYDREKLEILHKVVQGAILKTAKVAANIK